MESLERICTRLIANQLQNHRSGLFGDKLPGIIEASLPGDEILHQELWSEACKHHTALVTIPRARPFFGSMVVTELNLVALNDALARELSPTHFPHLRSLVIRDSPRLTDIGLGIGPSKFTFPLESITFRKCPQITWKGVAKLPASARLELIDACTGAVIPNENELFPKQHPRTSFRIEGNGIGLDAIIMSLKAVVAASIVAAQTLEELDISKNAKIDDEFAFACAQCSRLERVALTFSMISCNGIPGLAFMDSLKTLDLSFSAIRFKENEETENTEFWAAFKRLETLNLSGLDFALAPSRTLLAIVKGCPLISTLIVRQAKLRGVTRECAIGMFTKLQNLDLSLNKHVGDNIFDLPYDTVSIIETLNLTGTGVHDAPSLSKSNWPFVKSLILDATEPSIGFIVRLVGFGQAQTAANLVNVSLRHCETLTDAALQRLCATGGFRESLRLVDISHCHFSLKTLYSMKAALTARNHDVVVYPVVPDTVFSESTDGAEADDQHAHALNNSVAGDNHDDARSTSSESSIDSGVLRRFVREVDLMIGAEQPSSSGTSDQSSLPDSLDIENNIEAAALTSELIAACCHCTACVMAHPGGIDFPKLRYTKTELLEIRATMHFSTKSMIG